MSIIIQTEIYVYSTREAVRLQIKPSLVVDDQYMSRSSFEIQAQMSKGYELAAPSPERSRPSPSVTLTQRIRLSWM